MADKSKGDRDKQKGAPVLEWSFGALGLVLALALIGFIAWEAVTRPEGTPPEIELRLEKVSPAAGGYVAEVTADNKSRQTAQGVQIEGTIGQGASQEQSTATLDYVPGRSETKGGLYFTRKPAAGEPKLRVLGYSRP